MIPRTLRSYGTYISSYRRYPGTCPPVRYTTTSLCVAVLDAVLQVLQSSRWGGGVEGGGSYIPCDPVYPPEVGYLGSHGLWYPVGS